MITSFAEIIRQVPSVDKSFATIYEPETEMVSQSVILVGTGGVANAC
jgi:hypothetical protein